MRNTIEPEYVFLSFSGDKYSITFIDSLTKTGLDTVQKKVL